MRNQKARKILITGGAGFIGSNLAERLLQTGDARVRIFDNLSRDGVTRNLSWLEGMSNSGNFEFVEGDVRDAAAVRRAAADVDEIYHLAAQVAVTTSVQDPTTDFQINAQGTINVLEAARLSARHPFLLYTSTNKVYGSLKSLNIVAERTRYRVSSPEYMGINETEPLDFHSPYGCSKGTADQYVRDYARIYNLPTVVFRMSCIAGPRQFGNEDQGWVAHFLYSVLAGRTITIFGDGLQVRDILHVHDLIDAMMAVGDRQEITGGQIYNLGGGLERAMSINEMLRAVELETGQNPRLSYDSVRPGDQPHYVTDTRKLQRDAAWKPRRSVPDILKDIHSFWSENSAGITLSGEAPRSSSALEEVA